jgi:hypothetical protein
VSIASSLTDQSQSRVKVRCRLDLLGLILLKCNANQSKRRKRPVQRHRGLDLYSVRSTPGVHNLYGVSVVVWNMEDGGWSVKDGVWSMEYGFELVESLCIAWFSTISPINSVQYKYGVRSTYGILRGDTPTCKSPTTPHLVHRLAPRPDWVSCDISHGRLLLLIFGRRVQRKLCTE